MSETSSRMRSDAAENRDRILTVARQTYATRGLGVTQREIARRAGVGVATLYRHFPTRESLIIEAFREQLASCAAIVDVALADPDPWHGIELVIEKLCAMQATDRGFTDAFVTAFPDAIDFAQVRGRAERGLAELTRRAKASGALRSDFLASDFTSLIIATGSVAAVSPDAARRLAAYLLQSFRAHPADPPAPLPRAHPLGLRHVLGAASSAVNKS